MKDTPEFTRKRNYLMSIYCANCNTTHDCSACPTCHGYINQIKPDMSKTMTLNDFQKMLADAGYNYGKDAAENALVGYELAQAHFAEHKALVEVNKKLNGQIISLTVDYCRELWDNGEWDEIEKTLRDQDAEIARLREKADKFMWQVRDTCTRAEKAEALLRECIQCTVVSMHPATFNRIKAHLGEQ